MGALLPALLLLPALARGAAPSIHLYTMGAGEHPFTRFGHAAMCVRGAEEDWGRCYNYGTTDFSTPVPLSWDFVRGRALFWVSTQGEEAMVASYERQDRTVYRQELPLVPDEARALAEALLRSTEEDQRYYRYHHFLDNCTTRLRDLIDRHTSGALSREPGRPVDPSYREQARRGFAGDLPLLLASELVLGRGSDRPISRWEAMFLPDVLREEVAARLGARAEVAYARAAPLGGGSEALARGAMLGLGLGLAGLVAALPRAGRAVAGLGLGGLAALLWGLAVATALPELRWNEVLLVLWPTDLLLPFLGARRLRGYAAARALALLVLSALSATGALSQPLVAPAAMVALPMLALARARPA